MSDTPLNSDDIRRRAEAIVAKISKNPTTLPLEAGQQTLHDLHVHQIELEMQNEELRRIQVELEASRARYFDLYDLAPVGYVTLSEEGIIREANLTLVDLLGLVRKEVVQRPLTHFIFPADQDIFYQHRRQLFATGAPQVCELRLLRANDDPFWAQLEAIKVQHADGEPTCRVILSNISTRKQAEEALRQSHHRLEEALDELHQTQAQLVQQERLAAIGHLAAGIAHDFNNILAIITLYIDLSLHNPSLPPAIRDRLEVVSRQTNRAAHLVQQILDFSRRAVLQTRSLDLVSFLQEQIELWRRTIPESIKIHFSDEAINCIIKADPTRLQQIFTNLVLNARDAMPDGGDLRFSLKPLWLDSHDAPPLPDMSVGDWVKITVSDTGTGIPPAALAHIFEPFFTTKEPGQGSGLGLAQVYGIVKQYQGHIDVQSREGGGTTFTIYLPALIITLPKATAVLTRSAPTQGHGEIILVVEDNENLREALARTLELLNYQVLTAVDGREALAILEQPPENLSTGSEPGGDTAPGPDIALVLSDLVMPEMGGKELLQELRQRGRTVPFMILSGHPLEADLQTLQTQGLAGWLLKPTGIEELAAAVALAL
jgi:PAS domain S-box-containing protein